MPARTITPTPTAEEATDILALGKLPFDAFKRTVQSRPEPQRTRLFLLTGSKTLRECHATCARIHAHYLIPLLD